MTIPKYYVEKITKIGMTTVGPFKKKKTASKHAKKWMDYRKAYKMKGSRTRIVKV